VKGSAQTFGLSNAAKLANELENLLSRQEITKNKSLQISFFEGIGLLILALRQKNAEFPATFIEKLQNENAKLSLKNSILLTNLPYNIFRKLSESEKNAIIDAFCAKKNVFSINVSFEKTKFAANYQIFRDLLSKNGEIIAALPDAEFNSAIKIGFRILTATTESAENFSKITENFQAEIISFYKAADSANDLTEMLLEITEHTQSLAGNVGSVILANDVSLSVSMTKTVFEVLLQLVRNAVDHAFEKAGELKIFLFAEGENLVLTVSDNGKGIDLEKVRRRAVEKNLILSNDVLNEQQTLELIFASELSTAKTVSEISGRGVGLDIVKNSVEKLNGKISVKSRKGFGTKFEIILPLEEI
jgi:chemotaxis protein histidine kinase CheA